MIARAIITTITGLPAILLHKSINLDNPYSVMICKNLIPSLIGPLLVFGIADEICLKLKLYDKHDSQDTKEALLLAYK